MVRDIVSLLFIFSIPMCLYCKNITLTEEEPIFLTILNDILVNDSITICIEEEKEERTLQVFYPFNLRNSDSDYPLYDGNDLTNNTKWRSGTPLFQDAGYMSLTSNSGCFTVLNTGDTENYEVITFRWKEIQAKNCDYDNVMTPPQYTQYFKSTPDGICEALLFVSRSMGSKIPSLFITSIEPQNNQTFELKSTLNGRSLIKLNTAWSYFGLYVPVITVILPPNSMIAFSIAYINKQTITNDGTPNNKGAMASPGYSGLKQENYSLLPLYTISNDDGSIYYINFNIKIIQGQEKVRITSDMDDQSSTFTSNDIGKTLFIYGTTIQITNYENDPITDYFLFEYEYLSEPNFPTTIPLIDTTTPMELTTNKFHNPYTLDVSATSKSQDTDISTIMSTEVPLSTSTKSTTRKSVTTQKNQASKTMFDISFIYFVVGSVVAFKFKQFVFFNH